MLTRPVSYLYNITCILLEGQDWKGINIQVFIVGIDIPDRNTCIFWTKTPKQNLAKHTIFIDTLLLKPGYIFYFDIKFDIEKPVF